MAHQRELIRKAVVAQLAAANTSAGPRVTSTRVEPHKRGHLPALSVYALRELVDPGSASSSPRELTRDLKLEIVGWVAHSEAVHVDDAMDALAEQVEAAMDADPYFGGEAAESILEETTMQVLEDDGRSDPMVGVITLSYAIKYRTSPAPGAALDDFRTVGATHDLAGGVPDTLPASDLFTVQETP